MNDTFSIIALVLFFAVLFPIFLNIHIYIDVLQKKGYFAIYLFGFLKIYGGYVTLYKEGVAFHLNRKKVALLPFMQLTDTRKKFEITDGFLIYSLRQTIEIGNGDNLGLAVVATALVKIISSIIFSILNTQKKYLSLKSKTILLSDKNVLKAAVKSVVVFNLLVVAIAAIKIILEKIIEYEHNRKKQKSRRNGRNIA